MFLFDSIIEQTGEKFGLGDKSGSLLAALLAHMTERKHGGFAGFIERFNRAGLGSLAESWIMAGRNTPLSYEQVESIFSDEEIGEIAVQAGTDKKTATSAMAFMIPQVVDKLTPDGIIPPEENLLSKIGDYLSEDSDAAGKGKTDTLDRVGTAAEGVTDAGRISAGTVMDRIDAGTFAERESAASDDADEIGAGTADDSFLNYLFPLLIFGFLIALGFWFCGRS